MVIRYRSTKKVRPYHTPINIHDNSKLSYDTLLNRSITPKTKVILLNSPHNPTGKVFTLQELEAIAQVVRDHPHVTIISDEVYKYTVYDTAGLGDAQGSPLGHHHFARLPGNVATPHYSTSHHITHTVSHNNICLLHASLFQACGTAR